MKMIPLIVIAEVTVGFVMVEAPKVAVSPLVLGMFAGVQLGALFQLLLAGTAFQVCAKLDPGTTTRPHSAAMDDASSRVGLPVVVRGAIF